MKEKLNQTEIEERKKKNMLESAKINSCISGIPLSDIIQSGIQRGNYGEKDCLIKQQFLKNLVEPTTSRELHDTLKRQGYNAKYSTFKGLLYRYQKYEYVVKLNEKKPFIYGLTELGYQHIKNPYLAREEMARQRLNFIYGQIEKELVEHPGALKALLESITQMNIGSPIGSNVIVSNSGSQYLSNDFGGVVDYNTEKGKEVLNKIDKFDFKNIDKIKLNELGNYICSIKNNDLREDALSTVFEKLTKNTIVISQKEYQSSKPEGERKYYSVLVNAINHKVTESLYKSIPFRFIKVSGELRLKSISESGIYSNNRDGNELDFNYVNRTYFYNSITIKSKPNPEKRELEFYYVNEYKGNWTFSRKITTMSFHDYERAKRKGENQTLKINVH